MKIGEAIIGDIVEYQKEVFTVLGYYKPFCDSSTEGMLLVRPCEKSSGKYLRLSCGRIINVKSLKKTGRKLRGKRVLIALREHNNEIDNFEEHSTEEEPAIMFCYKIEK